MCFCFFCSLLQASYFGLGYLDSCAHSPVAVEAPASTRMYRFFRVFSMHCRVLSQRPYRVVTNVAAVVAVAAGDVTVSLEKISMLNK